MIDRKKPPYVIGNQSGFYWQPRGRMAQVSSAQELGKDHIKAYQAGWNLYYDAKAALKQPSGKPAANTVSWGAYAWRESDDFLFKSSGEPKAKRTKQSYEMGLKVIEAKLGKIDLRAIRRENIKKWHRELREQRGASMAASVIRTLRALYSFFRDQGWYPGENPAAKMRLHVPRRQYVPWTPERIDAFYKAAVEQDRRSVGLGVALIYDTAQNPSDVLAMRWDQFDGIGLALRRGKTNEANYVPLSADCLAKVKATAKQSVQIVVSEETKRPYNYRNFAKWVSIIRGKAGLPDDLKAGNLRHEAGDEAEKGGADPGAIQALFAHRSVGTQQYYVKRQRADSAQAARQKWREQSKKA